MAGSIPLEGLIVAEAATPGVANNVQLTIDRPRVEVVDQVIQGWG